MSQQGEEEREEEEQQQQLYQQRQQAPAARAAAVGRGAARQLPPLAAAAPGVGGWVRGAMGPPPPLLPYNPSAAATAARMLPAESNGPLALLREWQGAFSEMPTAGGGGRPIEEQTEAQALPLQGQQPQQQGSLPRSQQQASLPRSQLQEQQQQLRQLGSAGIGSAGRGSAGSGRRHSSNPSQPAVPSGSPLAGSQPPQTLPAAFWHTPAVAGGLGNGSTAPGSVPQLAGHRMAGLAGAGGMGDPLHGSCPNLPQLGAGLSPGPLMRYLGARPAVNSWAGKAVHCRCGLCGASLPCLWAVRFARSCVVGDPQACCHTTDASASFRCRHCCCRCCCCRGGIFADLAGNLMPGGFYSTAGHPPETYFMMATPGGGHTAYPRCDVLGC
jgi:hypothetical protein